MAKYEYSCETCQLNGKTDRQAVLAIAKAHLDTKHTWWTTLEKEDLSKL